MEAEETTILKEKDKIQEKLKTLQMEQDRLNKVQHECDQNANEFRHKEQVFFILIRIFCKFVFELEFEL